MSFAFAPDEKLNVYTGDFKVDVLARPLHPRNPANMSSAELSSTRPATTRPVIPPNSCR